MDGGLGFPLVSSRKVPLHTCFTGFVANVGVEGEAGI